MYLCLEFLLKSKMVCSGTDWIFILFYIFLYGMLFMLQSSLIWINLDVNKHDGLSPTFFCICKLLTVHSSVKPFGPMQEACYCCYCVQKCVFCADWIYVIAFGVNYAFWLTNLKINSIRRYGWYCCSYITIMVGMSNHKKLNIRSYFSLATHTNIWE